MKKKTIRTIAVALTTCVAVSAVTYGVQKSSMVAQAEETLYGIEQLIQEVQINGGSYTILELVPEAGAAEIGYMVPGYEPALSTLDANTGEWSSWQENLSLKTTAAERIAYMNTLKASWEAFLTDYGFTENDAPVIYKPYEESETGGEDYAQISFADVKKTGYFQPATGSEGEQRYSLSFMSDRTFIELQAASIFVQHYYATSVQVNATNLDDLTDESPLYTLPANHVYEYQGIWGDIKATLSVSGGDASGGNGAGMTEQEKLDYYKAHYDEYDLPALYTDVVYHPLQQNDTLLDDQIVYVVNENSIRLSDEGQYSFVGQDEGYEYTFSTNSVYYKGGFENQEWFRQQVLNMDAKDVNKFPVEVITLTPAQLNKLVSEAGEEDADHGIPAFDMLYINSGLSTGHFTYGETDEESGGKNDLSQAAALALFDLVVSREAACLMDATILYDTYETNESALIQREALSDTSIFYLCLLLSQNTPSDHSYEDGNTSVSDLWDSMVQDDDGNFVVENVYSFVTPEKLLTPNFYTPSIFHDGDDKENLKTGFTAVYDQIEVENRYREADTSNEYKALSLNISQATAVRHVIDYKYRRDVETKEVIRVLEIQPSKSDAESPDLTEDEVRKWVKNGDKVKSVEITTMTTAEFIGVIEDINENYDLVYIGTDRDHMNVSSTGSTVFNDTLMNGLIYYHVGDRRYVAMELAGMLDSEYVNSNRANDVYYYNPVRYNGNDITKEKMDALMSFLDASYPIVVSDEFFRKPVTLFSDTNYNKETRAAYSCDLDVGAYDMGQLEGLGVGNDQITSIKVKEGYEAILYWDSGFRGATRTVTMNVGYLDGGWNDQLSSIEVKAIEGAERTREIDADHIDDSSYMYEFVQKAMSRSNFYARSDISASSELFNFYLNRPKVSLADLSVTYDRKDDGGVYHISPNSRGKYLLEYSFTIQNEGAASNNTQYSCDLLIDVNADGKYSDSESISNDITITWNNEVQDPGKLYAGRRYTLTRVVPDGYKGVLPWKIQISQVNNANIHNSVMGYTKLDGMKKEVINILQICRDPIQTPDWWGGEGEALFRLDNMISDPNGVYHKLIYGGELEGENYPGISDEFEINVTFKTINQLEAEYTEGYMDNFNMLILGFSDAYGDFEEKYNAQGELVGALGGIVDFITSGKSVLFAHDSMGYFNYDERLADNSRYRVGVTDRTLNNNQVRQRGAELYTKVDYANRYFVYDKTYNGWFPSYNGVWIQGRETHRYVSISNQYRSAYNLTNQLRDLVGMDVYGVKELAALRAGTGLEASDTTGAWKTVTEYGKDVPYKAKSARTAIVPEAQGFTYAIINAKDWNIYSGREGEFSAIETLASDNGWTNKYLNLKYGDVYYYDRGDEGQGVIMDQGEIVSPYNGEVSRLLVQKVNSGQITDYPYKLKDEFMVSTTHNQYYQLDFSADDDGDGQSDLVVWFCLGGRVKANGERQETIYSISPKDVSNNYYIYNKGNITYTGVGHAGASGGTTVEEAKLFINTMIASYSAGIKEPTISVLSEGKADSAELKGIYSYYDDANSLSFSTNSEGGSASARKVYFTVTDVNFINGTRSILTNFYYGATGAGTQALQIEAPSEENPTGTTVNVKPLNLKIYSNKDNREVTSGNLESGGIYYIYVDDSLIQSEIESGGNQVFTLYFEAQTIINKKGLNGVIIPMKTDTSYAQFDFTQVNLFDLE